MMADEKVRHLWEARLQKDKQGNPKPTIANIMTVLRGAPEFIDCLCFDEFAQTVIWRSPIEGEREFPPWYSDGHGQTPYKWLDVDDVYLTEWCQLRNILIGVDSAHVAVNAVAKENVFHPVVEYLGSLEWDGIQRLCLRPDATEQQIRRAAPIRYLGCRGSPFEIIAFGKWMLSAVARILSPGCQVDAALILEGSQGTGKSSALKILGGDYFTDDIADVGSKDAAMQMAGAWIIELAELDALNRAEVSRIKAFLSRRIDRYRPPYGRRIVDQPRQCVFAGTVNSNEYLHDETGNRRFWPITTGRIDLAGLADARDQLWAEAVALYGLKQTWHIEAEPGTAFAESVRAEQAFRLSGDVWESTIEAHLVGYSHTTVKEVLENGLKFLAKDITKADQMRAARCLRVLGWTRKRTMTSAARQVVWSRAD